MSIILQYHAKILLFLRHCSLWKCRLRSFKEHGATFRNTSYFGLDIVAAKTHCIVARLKEFCLGGGNTE